MALGGVWHGSVEGDPDSVFYFDPASGRRFDQGAIVSPSGEYEAPRLPSPQDWVLVMEKIDE